MLVFSNVCLFLVVLCLFAVFLNALVTCRSPNEFVLGYKHNNNTNLTFFCVYVLLFQHLKLLNCHSMINN